MYGCADVLIISSIHGLLPKNHHRLYMLCYSVKDLHKSYKTCHVKAMFEASILPLLNEGSSLPTSPILL